MRFYFVRHGESLANSLKEIAVPETPLTKLGIEQARETARNVKGLGVTEIACSSFLRAQQTAETIAGELGIDLAHIKVLKDFGERDYGELKGKPKTYGNEAYFSFDTEHGVESRAQIIKRMQASLEEIKELGGQTGLLLVVGHAVSGFYLTQVAKGKTEFEDFDPFFQIDNAGYIEIEI